MSIIIFRSHNSVCLKITNYISEVLKVIDIGDSIILRTIIIQKIGFDITNLTYILVTIIVSSVFGVCDCSLMFRKKVCKYMYSNTM